MNKYRLIFIQIMLTILAAAFALAVIYVKETADIPASANGATYESNITLGDLARRTAKGGTESGR